MINLDATLILIAICAGTIGATLSLQILSWKSKRRACDLRTANKAMRTYYLLLEEIIDDPALPDDAADFLSVFADILPQRKDCAYFSNGMLRTRGNGSKEQGSRMFDKIEVLGKTRPDLRDKFHKAVANGIIAAFHRWPGDSWKFSQMMQEFASDPKKEFQLVYKMAYAKDTRTSKRHAHA